MCESHCEDAMGETECKTCANCSHFRPHYAKNAKGEYTPLLYGHCVTPRIKKRFVDSKACFYWEERNG